MSTPQEHRLDGALVFSTAAAALAGCVATMFRSGTEEVVDLSGVTHTDSAGLALLLELARRAAQDGKGIAFRKAPQQLLGLARFFGVDRVLRLEG